MVVVILSIKWRDVSFYKEHMQAGRRGWKPNGAGSAHALAFFLLLILELS